MKLKGVFSFFWEIIQIVIIALVIVVPIRYFVFQPFMVRGASMEPNFHNGDYLIVDELSYRLREPERGEIIVFNYPQDPSQRLIKRVIGLPGERVELTEGKITVIDHLGSELVLNEADYLLPSESAFLGQKKIVLSQDEYFVLGDNRSHSFDSRRFGPLERKHIIGRALIRAWPFNDITFFAQPEY